MKIFNLALLVVIVFISGCGILNSTASDQATLDALQEAGSDLTKVHPFDFYFYHSEQLGAQQLCAALRDQRFEATVRSGAIDGEWLCLASFRMVPSIDKLTELNSLFNDLIDQHGGEYDGWETLVVPQLTSMADYYEYPQFSCLRRIYCLKHEYQIDRLVAISRKNIMMYSWVPSQNQISYKKWSGQQTSADTTNSPKVS